MTNRTTQQSVSLAFGLRPAFGAVLIAVVFVCLLPLSPSHGQDWSRFLGPGGNSTSQSGKTPTQWDATTNIKWKTELPGWGASSPIIVGDRVLLTCYTGYGTGANQPDAKIENLARHLLCFDRKSGQQIWIKTIANENIDDEDPYKSFITQHGYATNTPVSDGKSVYVYFGKPGLFAYDLDGNERWHKTIDYQINETRWGSAASPILYGDQLILNAVEETGKIISFAQSDGKVKWEFDPQTKLAYATPNIVTNAAGKDELVVPVPEKVFGLDPNNGQEIWHVDNNFKNESNASVIVDGDIVYIYGGFRSVGSMAIRSGGAGNVTDSHVLWHTRDTSYVSTPILKAGHLYWISEKGIAYCVEAESGKRLYRERVPGVRGGRGIKFFASMLLDDDRMIAVSRRSGTFVVETKPKFNLISHNQIAGDDSEFNGSPAISGEDMFIRSNKFLYCIAQSGE